ncbi:MAG TPA: integrase core domain-containing protein [Polyangiaceae bacterium]|nr:integrase core domain-containing protein [Polyangiaceae bacterium]
MLRHQLTVLQRSVARPRVTRLDRIGFVALAAITPTWRNVLRIVQPETLLRWHRGGFKALWRWRSRTRPAPRLSPKTATLIRSVAAANRLWGAERTRGDLLKLGIKVSKRTVQRYMRAVRRECLDHVLLLDERHFQRVVAEYARYHNAARPHQGLGQQTPIPAERPAEGNIVALPVLGGLHHEYRRAA